MGKFIYKLRTYVLFIEFWEFLKHSYGRPEVQNTNANEKHKRKFWNTNANLKTQMQILKHKRKFENTNANSETQTQIWKHKRKCKACILITSSRRRPWIY